ncbi:hypothetical protein AXG93_4413s1250 [Marchantia polymorpha subsp. ruderalis]|uniref:Uncharacterized protein n=1 Tax=Marchantia polymorpha subsp. ruderalis TaxID=1480154 RepID=A0A176W308_MARPO|nr:hypothetical protein AXG93_4413s1250 [Marchantia polymorpha subsp. ruderalis]
MDKNVTEDAFDDTEEEVRRREVAAKEFNFQACEYAQRRSVNSSVRMRTVRPQRRLSNQGFTRGLMSKIPQLRLTPLGVPQIGLRAFQNELTALKLNFLLWGWNWVCPEMVREWLRERHLPSRGFRPHPERWQVSHWEQVLGRFAGEEGHLLFEAGSVKVSKEEEITFSNLLKNGKHSKNGYRIRDYKDRLRRNVAVALLQILQPHLTSYITCWQVGFVELALAGAPIHWARLLWKPSPTRQHAQEEKGGSINHLSPS